MTFINASHDDADGYACSIVAAMARPGAAITHIARYGDVSDVLRETLGGALLLAAEPATALVSDIGLDAGTLTTLATLARACGGERIDKGLAPHSLVVVDHHGSTLHALRDHATGGVVGDGRTFSIREEDGVHLAGIAGEPSLSILVDTRHCAATLCLAHADLYAGAGAAARLAADADLMRLVEHVEVIDLWKEDDSRFPMAMALVDLFDECRRSFVPACSRDHDPFMSGLMLTASRSMPGRSPATFELASAAIRSQAVDAYIGDDPLDDRFETTRYRTSRRLAREGGLYRRIETAQGPMMAAFDCEMGVYQRTSKIELNASAEAPLYVNVFRGGGLSLRSKDGSAQRFARRLGGGGHPDAAGATLPGGSVFSEADAFARLAKAAERGGPAG